MASYADLLRVVHGRYVHVSEIVAALKERVQVVSPAVEALVAMGTLRRLADRRLASTKATLGDLTKVIRERGIDPNAPLPTENERRAPADVAPEPASEGDEGKPIAWAKCPLCKTRFAPTRGNGYCPQCGAYLRVLLLD
ncbi:MAG TPA: hypothetical protein VN894_08485 [Polyangiaceae bacterium]|nr:hypothetical protein [Polyangiaceae bacterium]